MVHSLYITRCRIGSQCKSSRNVAVMWSYLRFRMTRRAAFLNDPYHRFQGHAILWRAEYLRNDTRYRHSFSEILIGTYTRPTQYCHNGVTACIRTNVLLFWWRSFYGWPNARPNKNLAIAHTDRASAAHTIRRGHLRDLEIYVKGHSRSLETEPLNRSYTTHC